MFVCLKKPSRRLARLAALLAQMLAAQLSPAQKIDQNANGMSDIWELVYGASSLNPSSDADGDGLSNALESIAGTNPFDPNSAPRIAASCLFCPMCCQRWTDCTSRSMCFPLRQNTMEPRQT